MKINKKRSTFCEDCTKDPKKCGENPIDCMKNLESEVYFKLYEENVGRI